MIRGLRIVAPFRPFPPEAVHHHALAAFDWIDAIRMMSDSAARAGMPLVQVITDVDTDLPVPCLHYVTHERRLMLWYLEIAACYLESDDFDRDTVMLDADQLIYQDLAKWFKPDADLGILVRTKLPKGDQMLLSIFNGVQWWAHHAKARLGPFYRRALALATTLPESLLVWGADTVALQQLLAPLDIGPQIRGDLQVNVIDSRHVLAAFSSAHMRWLAAGRCDRHLQVHPVLDFRGYRKPYMRAVYEATIANQVPA